MIPGWRIVSRCWNHGQPQNVAKHGTFIWLVVIGTFCSLYPLVMTNIAMENYYLQSIFSTGNYDCPYILMLNYQRVLGISSSQLTFIFFSRGLGIAPTSHGRNMMKQGQKEDHQSMNPRLHASLRCLPSMGPLEARWHGILVGIRWVYPGGTLHVFFPLA